VSVVEAEHLETEPLRAPHFGRSRSINLVSWKSPLRVFAGLSKARLPKESILPDGDAPSVSACPVIL